MSLVSQALGEKDGGINLLKDISGKNYQTVSDVLKGEGLTTIAFDLSESAAIAALGPVDGALLVQDLKKGSIPEAHFLILAQALVSDGLKLLGLTALASDATAFFAAIEAAIPTTGATN